MSTFERVARRYLRERGVNARHSIYDAGDRLHLIAHTNRAARMLAAIAVGLEHRLTRTAHAAQRGMRHVKIVRRGYGY